jgi:hypothetical protein
VSKLDKIRELLDSSSMPEDVAEEFCQLTDDEQAKFFVHVARVMAAWPVVAGSIFQAHAIGRHLATCECSTEQARELIRNIAAAMNEAGE